MTELRIDRKKLKALFSLMKVCDVHASRLAIASRHILPLTPLKSEDFLTLTDEQLGFMELLISRFGKLQDVIGSKFFPLLLELLQQDISQKSFLDILHRLEKFELLPSAKEWIDMRELRNHLIHEYPDNPALMANNLNKAVESSEDLLKYWHFLREKTHIIAEKWFTELRVENRFKVPTNMRLTPYEVEAIREAFRQFFAPEDHLWLFGSRTNPDDRGGDIDLYIETTISDVNSAANKKISFITNLYDKIGEQKIDVVLRLLSSDFHLPIYDIAKQEGVQLV